MNARWSAYLGKASTRLQQPDLWMSSQVGGAIAPLLVVPIQYGWRASFYVFGVLGYSGITFQQPAVWAICVDIGKHYAGAIAGCMNTAANLGGVASSALFGFLVEVSGSHDVPLVMMAVMLVIGASLWLKIDATEELIPESLPKVLTPDSAQTG